MPMLTTIPLLIAHASKLGSFSGARGWRPRRSSAGGQGRRNSASASAGAGSVDEETSWKERFAAMGDGIDLY